jgi:hypothetical protein
MDAAIAESGATTTQEPVTREATMSARPASRRSLVALGLLVGVAAVGVSAFAASRFLLRRAPVSAPASASAPSEPLVGLVGTRAIPTYSRAALERALVDAGYRIDATQDSTVPGATQMFLVSIARPPCIGSVQYHQVDERLAAQTAAATRAALMPPYVVALDGGRFLVAAMSDVDKGPSARCTNALLFDLTTAKAPGATPPEGPAIPPAPTREPPPPTHLVDDAQVAARLRAAGFAIARDTQLPSPAEMKQRHLVLRKDKQVGALYIARGYNQSPAPLVQGFAQAKATGISKAGRDWLVVTTFTDLGIGLAAIGAIEVQADGG